MIFKNISIGVTSLVSVTMFAATGAIAQINPAPTLSEQTLRDNQQQGGGGLNIGGSNVNLLQLLNQINLAGGKSAEQVRESQAESIDEAVSIFKNQQRREIQIEPAIKQ